MQIAGFCSAIVGRPHRFIRNAPSPSIAITLRFGRAIAKPAAIDETKPRVRVFEIAFARVDRPPLARAPAGANGQSIFRCAANCFQIVITLHLVYPEDAFSQQHRHRLFGVVRQNLRALQNFIDLVSPAQHVSAKTHRLKHRLCHRAERGKAAIAQIPGIIDQHQDREFETATMWW